MGGAASWNRLMQRHAMPCHAMSSQPARPNSIDAIQTHAGSIRRPYSSAMTQHPGARNKQLGPSGNRNVLGRTLLRERLELGGKRWSLQQQLAVFRNRRPNWSSPRTKTAEGSVEVLPSPATSPSSLSTDLPIWSPDSPPDGLPAELGTCRLSHRPSRQPSIP